MAGSPSEKRCHLHTCLLDLSADCLRLVLRQLRPRDVCTLATVCARLAEVATEDEVTWECFCRRLLDEQEDVSPGRLPNFDAPAALRAQLGLPSFRALYQVLHQLGGWPSGLWQRVDEGAEPYGELLQVRGQRGRLVGRSIIATGKPKETIFTSTAARRKPCSFLVYLSTVDYAGQAARLRLHKDGRQLTLTTGRVPASFIDGHGSLVHRISQRGLQQEMGGGGGAAAAALAALAAAAPGHNGIAAGPQQPIFGTQFAPQAVEPNEPPPGQNPPGQHQLEEPEPAPAAPGQPLGLGPLAWDHQRLRWMRMFHPLDAQQQVLTFERLPAPTPLHSEGVLPPLPAVPKGHPFPALAALSRLEGYWTGCYGPHGLEIIYLRLADGGEPGEQHCPCAATPRLVCMKVTGDRNVPAGKVTLFTLDEAPTLGHYTGTELVDEGDTQPRPVVAFQESGMEYINLGEREVLARYRANGQMSYIPGIWDPVWSRGQFLMYKDEGGGTSVVSMLFDDADEHFRHIIDYAPLPLPP